MFDAATYRKEWTAKNRERCRAYCKKYYRANRAFMLSRSNKRRALQKTTVHEWVDRYKSSIGCIDCGEKDPVVLDFDHRDRSTKIKGGVARLRAFASLSEVQKEIAKCDVRCANCHRRKTWKENH